MGLSRRARRSCTADDVGVNSVARRQAIGTAKEWKGLGSEARLWERKMMGTTKKVSFYCARACTPFTGETMSQNAWSWCDAGCYWSWAHCSYQFVGTALVALV